MNQLVIVESPAKAKTIEKFLGKGYKVLATVGHIRDLPKSSMGVDLENDFEPKYINIRGKGDTIKALRTAAKKADRVLLATDPDREGEAIAWHLAHILSLDADQKNRVVFHEITKDAVKHAVKNPRAINMELVDAQQARRVLDRLVGYSISPILWRKVKRGLSAGRVQSVATKLICDREQEILSFVPEEYWSIVAHAVNQSGKKIDLDYYGPTDQKKVVPSTEQEVKKILAHTKGKPALVRKVESKERQRAPQPAFTTSTLQQEAANKLGFATKKTMMLAQQLYEGIAIKGKGTIGLITYMRTDSTRIAESAQDAAMHLIEEKYGKSYLGPRTKKTKNAKNAQDAHEAIRPTTVDLTPEELTEALSRDQWKLYDLIWSRFIASQMASATFDATTITATVGDEVFRASGSVQRFDGFMKVYVQVQSKDHPLPEVKQGEELSIRSMEPEQHFTQPPSRYTEASLVKEMEENGIGRPSTYAPTITTILSRGYVEKEKKLLKPTELGQIINEIMTTYFREVVSVDFTANMETHFDRIEENEESWKAVIRGFYGTFEPLIEKADHEIEKIDVTEMTDLDCPKCGSKLLIRSSR
ncbi:MAG: type I DNA topoisomerase, partial [Bacillota bacterium]|nr:type I DNA topoisomerase [Bacillota bacterium]